MPPYGEIHAPGKLVLLGEDAVLDGAPALVIAINRGVRCTVMPGHGIETPDGDTRFVAPALTDTAAARYVFRSWNPVDLPGKPGFGGSAAACVAACVAAGRPPHDAFAIHHTVQGSGSGIDIAASIHGGTMRFENRVVTPQPDVLPVVIWSGQSAKTGPRVERYRSWSNDRQRQRFIDRSAQAVAHVHVDPVAAFADNWAALKDMAISANVPYTTPALTAISALASRFGGAAKPSGAGGGDCAVAVFDDPDRQHAFEAACDENGWTRIPIVIADGARRVPLR